VCLVEKLKIMSLPSCGTVHSNRKGLPELKSDKDLRRGECDQKIRSDGIGCVKWKDKRSVVLLSTIDSPAEMTTVKRKENNGNIIEIPCPKIVKSYTSNMGCVDKADLLKSFYAIDRKAQRFWLRLFWHFVDVAVVNC
jgi:hypothetical protein